MDLQDFLPDMSLGAEPKVIMWTKLCLGERTPRGVEYMTLCSVRGNLWELKVGRGGIKMRAGVANLT
jgi:hypothetical protein